MMEFINIKGFRGGNLYYVQEDGHLFIRKTLKSGKMYLACYDTIRTKKQKIEDPDFKECQARCSIDSATGVFWRNLTCHRDHDTHELIYRDLQSLNSMKDQVRYLAANFPFSARRIPIKEIFLTEMAK